VVQEICVLVTPWRVWVKRLLIVFIILLLIASTAFAGPFNNRSGKDIPGNGRGLDRAADRSPALDDGLSDGDPPDKPGGGGKG
jgi:hypothetical protein